MSHVIALTDIFYYHHNMCTVVYFEQIAHRQAAMYSLAHQLCINPLLKILQNYLLLFE